MDGDGVKKGRGSLKLVSDPVTGKPRIVGVAGNVGGLMRQSILSNSDDVESKRDLEQELKREMATPEAKAKAKALALARREEERTAA